MRWSILFVLGLIGCGGATASADPPGLDANADVTPEDAATGAAMHDAAAEAAKETGPAPSSEAGHDAADPPADAAKADAGQSDAAPEAAADAGDDAPLEACVPINAHTCGSMCGMVSDGCGGTVQCECADQGDAGHAVCVAHHCEMFATPACTPTVATCPASGVSNQCEIDVCGQQADAGNTCVCVSHQSAPDTCFGCPMGVDTAQLSSCGISAGHYACRTY